MGENLCSDRICVSVAIAHGMTLVLGVLVNGAVIWIAAFKVKKSVSTIWYLSLAVIDFLFCTSMAPFLIARLKRDWIFGSFMCNFSVFFMHFNMYNSVFLLVIISVDRCAAVKFPVWKRTTFKALVAVLLTCVLSATLSMPYARFSYTGSNHNRTYCSFTFPNRETAIITYVRMFIFGFVIPFLIIISSIVILKQAKTNQTAQVQKFVKVIMVLSVAFVICLLPFQTVSLVHLNDIVYVEVFIVADIVRCYLFFAFFFVKPFIYAFVGKSLKTGCYAPCSKIQNVVEDCDGGDEEIQGSDLL